MAYNEYLIGKRERLSWVDETSFGTGGNMSTSGEVIGLNATIEPNFNQNWQEVLSAGADSRGVEDRVLGPRSYGFTLSFTPVNWKFLKYCGYSVSDVDEGDYYSHTFSLSNTVQSFKLEWAKRASTSVVYTITGCVVKNATINYSKATGEGEGMISVKLDCVAQSVSDGSSVTSISNITRSPFQWRNVKFTFEGSEIVEVNNGEISINNGIDENDSRYCNTTADRDISEPIPKIHRITGRANVNVKDNTYFTAWSDATKLTSDNKLEFIKTVTEDELELDMSGVVLSTANEPTNLEGVDNADLVFKAESFDTIKATDDIATY